MLASYKNGNYTVRILHDGTKERVTYADEFLPEFPESIDLKITNRCDAGCPFCHEVSTPYGSHGKSDKILRSLEGLPEGVEIALGGGNVFEFPNLEDLLVGLAYKGLIANMTINAKHLKDNISLIEALREAKLVYGLGISYDGLHFYDTDNVVYHMIVGVHTFGQIKSMVDSGRKILLLGYKERGRGKTFYSKDIESEITFTRENLWELLGKSVVSFDNLALDQLDVNKHITRKGWDRMFMGNDGSFTMYYDAVKQEYAPSSTSDDRTPADIPVVEYFKNLRGGP